MNLTDQIRQNQRTLVIISSSETTKNGLERIVPYTAPTGVLLSRYLIHRATISRVRGLLFLSDCRRNFGEPLTLWIWSKERSAAPGVDWRIAGRRDLTHTGHLPAEPG